MQGVPQFNSHNWGAHLFYCCMCKLMLKMILHIPKRNHLHPLNQMVPITLIHVVTKFSNIIPVTWVLSEVKRCCYQCPVKHLYLHKPSWWLLHVCSYRNITVVDSMCQCLLTLWLHTTYTSSYYANTQILGKQYKVGPIICFCNKNSNIKKL